MKYISTRYIVGNRGDLLSRLGVLSSLDDLGLHDNVYAMVKSDDHLASLNIRGLSYGIIYNTIPNIKNFFKLVSADGVLWIGGLDLSDDSSKLKLLYILFNFSLYRLLGLKIFILNQGAGPIHSKFGRNICRIILSFVSIFVVRDRGSLKLLQDIFPEGKYVLGYDGIFSPKISLLYKKSDHFKKLFFDNEKRLVVGFNIREWYHFSGKFIPNSFKSQRSESKEMSLFLNATVQSISEIRSTYNAKVILISAYELNSVPDDDEIYLLQKIKQKFANDEQVILTDFPMSLAEYLGLIKHLDLVIGTRLHTTLTALRLHVVSINLNYTLKGRDILKDLNLDDLKIELDDFINDYRLLLSKINEIIDNKEIKQRIVENIDIAIKSNMDIYKEIFYKKIC